MKRAARGEVVSNPGILGGTPVFNGTRLPVQALFDYLADGHSLDYFLETFEGVTREQAIAVLRYGWERIAAELAGRRCFGRLYARSGPPALPGHELEICDDP